MIIAFDGKGFTELLAGEVLFTFIHRQKTFHGGIFMDVLGHE
jgi:hypothetical protein